MGVGITGPQYRWPNRTIPFEIDPAFPNPDRVAQAVQHWTEHTSIRFVPRNGEADYVRIARMPGYAVSDVGRRGGAQQVSLGDGATLGNIIHELGHTVGLWHEHCRGDRDAWIAIDFTNIQDGCEDNFAQNSLNEVPTPMSDLGGYDYGSIMHYPAICFEIDGDYPVITTLQPPGAAIGQRDGLSGGDIAAVEELYQGVAMPAGG